VFFVAPFPQYSRIANAANGEIQVGAGKVAADQIPDHALLWRGTADSVVDLQSLLPSEFAIANSEAWQIDDAGKIFGIAYANAGAYAVEWSPVPESASLAAALATLLTLRQRQSRSGGATSAANHRDRRT
jgi:hypothetical protein